MSGNHAVISGFSVAATGGLESRAWAPGPELPYLPLSTPSAAFPSTSGYTVTSVGAGNLQSALNSASCNPHGTILELPAGDVETGSFTLPNLTCAAGQWLILTTAGVVEGTITDLNGAADFPARGTRLDPSLWTSRLARITTSAGANTISCPTNTPCNHIWLVGVEIENASAAGFGMEGVSFGGGETNPANEPSFITLDRVYVHGKAGTAHLRRCLDLNGSNLVVVDSYISECHESGEDSQAIGTFASGPALIQNNFLESSTENILIGGSNTAVNEPPYNMQITDWTVQKNFLFKPLAWDPANSQYMGSGWSVKNDYEHKGGIRFLIQDNVLEHNWVGGQNAECVLMQPLIQSGLHVIQTDITFRFNLCEHMAAFFVLAGRDPTLSNPHDPVEREERTYIHDNLADDISSANWPSSSYCTAGESTGNDSATFDHNTVLPCTGTPTGIYSEGGYALKNFYFTNSIFHEGTVFGVSDDGTADGNPTINSLMSGPPAGALMHNVLIGGNCAHYSAAWSCPAAWSGVGFVNYNSGDGGDYRLCTGVNSPASGCAAASPYAAGQANGCTLNPAGSLDPGPPADCGANVAQLDAAIAGVAIFPANAPAITSLSPSSMVCNGTNTLTISGTNLAEQGTEALVNNVAVAESGVTSTSITIAPPAATGVTVPVTVDNFGLPVTLPLTCQ